MRLALKLPCINIFDFYINKNKISFNLFMHFACSPFWPVVLPHRQGLFFSLYSTRQQSSPFVRWKDKIASFTDVYNKVAAAQPLPTDTEIAAGLVETEDVSDNDSLVEFKDKAVEIPSINQLLQVIETLQRLS